MIRLKAKIIVNRLKAKMTAIHRREIPHRIRSYILCVTGRTFVTETTAHALKLNKKKQVDAHEYL